MRLTIRASNWEWEVQKQMAKHPTNWPTQCGKFKAGDSDKQDKKLTWKKVVKKNRFTASERGFTAMVIAGKGRSKESQSWGK